jgi:hypothetical protein
MLNQLLEDLDVPNQVENYRKLLWPFTKAQTAEHLAKAQRCRMTLNDILQIKQTYTASSVLPLTKDTK